ncbi:MAG: hypothetical protein J7M40_10395 [Planctomycetes bacterium]|nr:hypothetical protein [Planctomycetota bacterium]
MKVCYFISTCGHGRGGHFYSLKETANALKDSVDCVIINIGMFQSPIIDSINVTKYDVYFNGLNPIGVAWKIFRILRKEKPDVLHAFDFSSHFFSRLISLILKVPAIQTKPGGPNPNGFFPYAETLILYSLENEKYFSKAKEFSNTKLYCVPNRISPFESDVIRIKKIRERIDNSKPIFLRICRIYSDYKESIIQSIDLVNRLNKEGCPCQFILIGVVQNVELFQELSAMQSEVFSIICDEEFTVNAGLLIDFADYVVGTGSGIMEAASKGKVLLTPLAGKHYPLLITPNNFKEVFATNFSPRNQVTNFNEQDNFQAIKNVLCDNSKKSILEKESLVNFDKYFNIYSVTDKYVEIYNTASYSGQKRLIDLAGSMYKSSRYFLSAYVKRLIRWRR